jgi:hypothetical protein
MFRETYRLGTIGIAQTHFALILHTFSPSHIRSATLLKHLPLYSRLIEVRFEKKLQIRLNCFKKYEIHQKNIK